MTSYLHNVNSLWNTPSNNVVKAPFSKTACMNKNKGPFFFGCPLWARVLSFAGEAGMDFRLLLCPKQGTTCKNLTYQLSVLTPQGTTAGLSHLLKCKYHLEGLNLKITFKYTFI